MINPWTAYFLGFFTFLLIFVLIYVFSGFIPAFADFLNNTICPP